jgi:hypothetical protein
MKISKILAKVLPPPQKNSASKKTEKRLSLGGDSYVRASKTKISAPALAGVVLQC